MLGRPKRIPSRNFKSLKLMFKFDKPFINDEPFNKLLTNFIITLIKLNLWIQITVIISEMIVIESGKQIVLNRMIIKFVESSYRETRS